MIFNITDWFNLFMDYINGIIVQVHFNIWLFSSNIMSLKFIHVLEIVIVHLFFKKNYCASFHFMNMPQLSILLLVIWVLLWTLQYMCFAGHVYAFLLGVCRAGLLGHRVYICPMSVGTAKSSQGGYASFCPHQEWVWVPAASHCPQNVL